MIYKFGAAVLALATSFNAYSQSSIQSPSWSFTDTFEGSVNNSFWIGEGVWVNYGVSDPTNSSNKVMAMRYIPNSEGQGDSWSEYDFKLPINAVQVEIQFDMYVPRNYRHVENNHKVFALWSGTYGKINANVSISSEAWGGGSGASPSVYVGVDGKNFGHSMLSTRPNIWNDGEGKWIKMHIYVELADGPNDYGRMELSKNGSLMTSTHSSGLLRPYSDAPDGPNLIPYSYRGNYIDQGTLMGWANGAVDGGFREETVFLIDNFQIKARSSLSAPHQTTPAPAVQCPLGSGSIPSIEKQSAG